MSMENRQGGPTPDGTGKAGCGRRHTVSRYGPKLSPEIIEAALNGGTGHPEIDARSLKRHRLMVAKIDAEPRLIDIAFENLERWMALKPERPNQCDVEWMEILTTKPWKEAREILLDESEEGQRLRSSSPFGGILTSEERRSFGPETTDDPQGRESTSRNNPGRKRAQEQGCKLVGRTGP